MRDDRRGAGSPEAGQSTPEYALTLCLISVLTGLVFVGLRFALDILMGKVLPALGKAQGALSWAAPAAAEIQRMSGVLAILSFVMAGVLLILYLILRE